MKVSKIFSKKFLSLIFLASIVHAQTLTPEDVQDFNKTTGIGCMGLKPVTAKADFYFVCKSNKSEDQAWDAALYRSKVACGKDKISVHFNVAPSIPSENGIYGAQVEVSCNKKP